MGNITPLEVMLYGAFFVMAGISLSSKGRLTEKLEIIKGWATNKDDPVPLFALSLVVFVIVIYVNWVFY